MKPVKATPAVRPGEVPARGVAAPTNSGPSRAERPLDEMHLVQELRSGNEGVFERLLDRYYAPMIRVASTYVRTREEAEEVVQDTWLAIVAGIHRFQGRSSLRTWMFRILVNRARTRAKREARSIPFSSIRDPNPGPRAFRLSLAEGSERQLSSMATPEDTFLADELQGRIEAAIGALPPRQREVITLRDLEGWSADEVGTLLQISDANQRVLLHRARVKVRNAIDPYLREPDRDDATVVSRHR